MNHHTPGVIIHPGATGFVDFRGVNRKNYILAFAGSTIGLMIRWEWPEMGLLRIYAHNATEKRILFIPLVKDDQPEPPKLEGSGKA